MILCTTFCKQYNAIHLSRSFFNSAKKKIGESIPLACGYSHRANYIRLHVLCIRLWDDDALLSCNTAEHICVGLFSDHFFSIHIVRILNGDTHLQQNKTFVEYVFFWTNRILHNTLTLFYTAHAWQKYGKYRKSPEMFFCSFFILNLYAHRRSHANTSHIYGVAALNKN